MILVIVRLFVVAVMLLALAGCNSDPVKSDLEKYGNTAFPIFNKLTADCAKKMEAFDNAPKKEEYLRNVVAPAFKELKDKMTAVKPSTKELQDIHNAYVSGLNLAEESVKELAIALEKNDGRLFDSANAKMDAGGQAEKKYKKDISELANKHNVKID